MAGLRGARPTLASLALAAALLCAGTALGDGALAPVGRAADDAGLLGVLEAHGVQGHVLLGLDADHSCGGTAPLTTACAADSFVAAEGDFLLYVVAGTPFTGTIRATLTDAVGNSATWTCTYLLHVSGVTPAPACNGASTGALQAGTLTLTGATQGLSLGYWEAHAVV